MKSFTDSSCNLSIISKAILQDRLAHAYLIIGPQGSGKRKFIRKLARLFLCNDLKENFDQVMACMSCSNCKKFEHGVHPDYLEIEPQGRMIKIDQVRELQRRLYFPPLEAKRCVCAINCADKLNLNAANALLKTLEEPPENTHLILGAKSPAVLLPTIVSRCQIIRIRSNETETIWHSFTIEENIDEEHKKILLHLSQGSTEQAKHYLAQGIFEIRNSLFDFLSSEDKGRLFFLTSSLISSSRESMELSIRLLRSLLRDLLLIQISGTENESLLYNADKANILCKLAGKLNCDSLTDYQKRLEEAEQMLIRNVNMEMIADSILIFWLKTDF